MTARRICKNENGLLVVQGPGMSEPFLGKRKRKQRRKGGEKRQQKKKSRSCVAGLVENNAIHRRATENRIASRSDVNRS